MSDAHVSKAAAPKALSSMPAADESKLSTIACNETPVPRFSAYTSQPFETNLALSVLAKVINQVLETDHCSKVPILCGQCFCLSGVPTGWPALCGCWGYFCIDTDRFSAVHRSNAAPRIPRRTRELFGKVRLAAQSCEPPVQRAWLWLYFPRTPFAPPPRPPIA